jgi:SAM-dependent methyltransferase
LSCRSQFPVVNGVPVLLRGIKILDNPEPPAEATLRAVCSSFDIPADDAAIQHLRDVFSKRYEFEHSFLEAENNYLLQRLNIDQNGRSSVDALARHGSGEHCFAVIRHYIPPELPCKATPSYNVRIRNSGTEPLARHSLGGWELRAYWTDADGQPRGDAGKATRLPITVLPGRELTVPFWLQTPAAPGDYRLYFILVRAGRHIDAPTCVPVRIRKTVPTDYPALDPKVGPLQPDYDEDHRVGIRIMERMIRYTGAQRCLEVGGSSSPMTCNQPCLIVSTDIDAQTVQVARFVYDRRGYRNLLFTCCDALDLPFPPGAFDFGAIFSSLHHFADPVAALCALAAVVKPTGFIVVMCEPAGHFYDEPDPEMQKVLEYGINEQRFTLEEYARMFHAAGLVAAYSQLDHDSLKVILTRTGSEPLPGELFDPPPAQTPQS